jgi:integrase
MAATTYHPLVTDTPDRAVGQAEVIDVFSTDREAIRDWMSSKPNASAHSIRAYLQAVDCLRRWIHSVRGEVPADALLTLRSTDAAGYLAYLLKGPTVQGNRLAASTIRHRITILSAMYAHWMTPRDGGRSIVRFNPFDGLAKDIQTNDNGNSGARRALSEEEQAVVESSLENLPRETREQEHHYRRARLIWLLASRMALRRFEIAKLKVNDFRRTAKGHWKIEILGKGRKDGQTPDVVIVPEVVIDEIRSYLEFTGRHREPLPSNASPLLKHIYEKYADQALTDAHVAKIMKTIFKMAADHAERDLREHHLAPRLKEASIHWGRHTWFMNALKDNDLKDVSRAGRHRNIATTMKSYVGTTEEDLAKVMASARPIGG